ncbi:cellulose biosynthesis cyclic di-GMP-binding regulatory protein BcsB [Photobacterium carnosum]|uniref:cellulose biosynthesis cyclic di-GMP-binding regulatory protein BcsB n=1 Tax=Photobacterium carnosum TaxID=2023717 RepID=UPI001E4FB717|nr:cellulose biosynthesis cyclic di-GMP-binding regulatory protein BcsB [Photobacterium carnosum]MCD9553573.1 cellulose biosynthesis cyclic di-GMP-binding regulatory protein BcsB [Photobacterium carnosum]
MKINYKLTVLSALLGFTCFTQTAFALDANQISSTQTDLTSLTTITPDSKSAEVTKRVIPFTQLGYNRSIVLQGSESNAYIGFGSRLDEVVSKANLYFDVTPSPALLSLVSHIKIYLNNELMGVVPIVDGEQGKQLHLSIPLDTRYFSNYNQIHFELIGNTKKTCSNPNDSSIWAEISQSSYIDLYVQKTKLKSDLSLLPVPFFDSRDFSRLNLPMVIGGRYNLTEMKAVGVLASHFGALAGWRGAEFPLSIDKLPDHNAIIFVTNDNKPTFLKDFPNVTGPRIQMITHPTDPYVKLLLVMGRDSKDLNAAVNGLAFGSQLLTGSIAKINQIIQLKPRIPYDAPNWINTSGSVTLSKLVKEKNMLQVEGRTPPSIQATFRLPPDLFTWHTRGIPLDLHYRYSPPSSNHSGSRLTLSINDEFIQAFNLNSSGHSGDDNVMRIPLIDNTVLNSNDDQIDIPAFKVDSKNQLDFQFGFASLTDGLCLVTQPSQQFAAIDGNSTIDFSGFSHYIKMPNIHAFSNSGFPFTRMADLSDTVIVLSPHPSREALQTYLNIMGFLGRSSGYTGLNVTLVNTWDKSILANKDILSIGVMPELKKAVNDPDQVNLVLHSSERQMYLPMKNEPLSNMYGMVPSNINQEVADYISVDAKGAFAAITGLESPYTKNRSLVSILAASPADFASVDEALNDSGKIDHMFGTVVTLRNHEVASYNVGDHFYMGELPILQLVWYHFSNHPVIVAIFAALLMVIVTIVLWRILRQLSAKRLAEHEEDDE